MSNLTRTLNKNRYRNISEAYVKTEPPPRTLAEAAMLVATALGRIQGANLEVTFFQNIERPTSLNFFPKACFSLLSDSN